MGRRQPTLPSDSVRGCRTRRNSARRTRKLMLSADSLAEENPTWVPVGCIDQIGLGQGRCFRVGPRKLALFRLRDGKVYALDAECPHRRGPLAEGVGGHDTVV